MSSDFRTFIVDDEFNRNNSIRVRLGSVSSLDSYVRRPVSLVQGLAKIGGFLGFLKVFSMFLSVFHEQLFMKDLDKVLNKKRESVSGESASDD